MSGNAYLLYIIAVLVAAIFFVLTYDIFDLGDVSLFHKKTKYHAFPAECFSKKVTLGDLCELCPEIIFRASHGGYGTVVNDPQKIDDEKMKVYKTLAVYNLDTKNHKLEVSDPSLL